MNLQKVQFRPQNSCVSTCEHRKFVVISYHFAPLVYYWQFQKEFSKSDQCRCSCETVSIEERPFCRKQEICPTFRETISFDNYSVRLCKRSKSLWIVKNQLFIQNRPYQQGLIEFNCFLRQKVPNSDKLQQGRWWLVLWSKGSQSKQKLCCDWL